MTVKPEQLQQDTTAVDSDLVMKTNSAGVTKTINAGNFFTWLWGKIKAATKSSADTSDPTAPINTNALNGALTNYTPFINVGSNVKTIDELFTEQGNQTVKLYWGQFTDSGASYSTGYVLINKTSNAYGSAEFVSDAGQFFKVKLNGVWEDWQRIALKSDLANYVSQWKGQALENGTDTGININGSYYGKTLIVIWSAQYGAGNDTNSGIDLIRCGFDQNIINVTHVTSDINNANFIPYYYVSTNGTLLIASSLNVVYAKIIDNR